MRVGFIKRNFLTCVSSFFGLFRSVATSQSAITCLFITWEVWFSYSPRRYSSRECSLSFGTSAAAASATTYHNNSLAVCRTGSFRTRPTGSSRVRFARQFDFICVWIIDLAADVYRNVTSTCIPARFFFSSAKIACLLFDLEKKLRISAVKWIYEKIQAREDAFVREKNLVNGV